MKISIIIPVYNEEKTVENIINKMRAVDLGIEKEIIVVDDGSQDKTTEIVEKYIDEGIRLIKHPQNRGKGAAIRTGFSEAKGDIVLIQDADLEYDPYEYKKLLEILLKKEADVAYGSRFKERNPRIYLRYYLGNRLLSLLISILYRSKITDAYTCYKAIPKKILDKLDLKANGFEIEAEITIKLLKKRCKIKEVPISYNPRTLGEGKKIGLKDGIKGLAIIFKELVVRTSPL